MNLDFILHPTTNFHSCSISTLVDVLAQILDSSQSSRDFNIDMTIKEKKKLRTVGDHILIGESCKGDWCTRLQENPQRLG